MSTQRMLGWIELETEDGRKRYVPVHIIERCSSPHDQAEELDDPEITIYAQPAGTVTELPDETTVTTRVMDGTIVNCFVGDRRGVLYEVKQTRE